MLSSGQEFDEKFLDSKHVLKVYFKPSRKKKYFIFLAIPILPGRLKILHLTNKSKIMNNLKLPNRNAIIMISQFHRLFDLIFGRFLLFGPAVWRHLSQKEERRILCYSVLQSAVSVGNNVRKSTSVVIFFHEFFRVTHMNLKC